MKLNVFYLMIFMPFLFIACDTEGFVELNDESVFFIEGKMNGQTFNIQAGENGVVNNTNVVDQNGRWDYVSSFSIPNDPTVPFSKLSFNFNDYEKIIDEAGLRSRFLEDNVDFVLNFTGSEGLVLEPETSGISDPFVTAWTIDGKGVTTQMNPIIPLPFLEESDYIDVRYSLNIANKFRGTIISQFSKDLTQSCHGELIMDNDGLVVEVWLNSLSGSFDEVGWSNGSTGLSTVIASEAQELVVEATTGECQLSAQIEISDPNAIPEQLTYSYSLSEGPASDLTNTGLIVELVRNDGTIFRSDFISQSIESALNINAINAHDFKANDLDSYEIAAIMVVQLSDLENTETISVDLSNIQFALSHPNP